MLISLVYIDICEPNILSNYLIYISIIVILNFIIIYFSIYY